LIFRKNFAFSGLRKSFGASSSISAQHEARKNRFERSNSGSFLRGLGAKWGKNFGIFLFPSRFHPMAGLGYHFSLCFDEFEPN